MLFILERVVSALPFSLALVAATWLFLRFARQVNAATRHAAWWVVLAIVLVLPFKPEPHFNQPESGAVEASGTAAVAGIEALRVELAPESTLPAWLAAAMLGVTVMFLMRLVFHFLRLHWIKWRATAVDPARLQHWKQRALLGRRVLLRESPRVHSPAACGYLVPAILLPKDFAAQTEPGDLDHVLLHELAHLARRDDWTQLLARLVEAIAWWHPLVQFCLRRVELEREAACDDWAVALAGDPQPYAASLARLMERRLEEASCVLSPAIGGRRSQFAKRIERLMNPQRLGRPRFAFGPVGASLLLLTAITLGATRLPALVEFDSAPPEEHSSAGQTKASYLAGLAEAGYRDLSVEEIIHLKNNQITGRYMAEMNEAFKGRLKPEQLVGLHQRGVKPAHLRAARQYGDKLTLEQVIRLKDAGVL